MSRELEVLQRRLERERSARREAEAILEQKALELYHANNALRSLNEGLEHEVADRTAELSTEQTRLRSLITNLDSGVLLENENRQIVLVNSTFCALFNIPALPEHLEGADCSQSAEQVKHFFADPDYFVARIETLLLHKEVCVEEVLPLADGRIFSRTFIPVFANQKYLGHLWKYRDTTQEYYAAETLRQSEEKYRGLIENMELGLMEVDNCEKIVRAYPRFCEMTGYFEAELIGRSAVDTFLPPEFLPVLQEQSQQRSTGKAGAYEIQIFKKGGGRIWVLISGAPIFGPDGHIVGSLGIHYDITAQKKLQRDLEEARFKAEAAQEAEKQFLANMSHEIRTPLNAIIGMAHLLYDTQPTPEQREYLDILRNSSEMLRNLISDVLDLSKIRAGHLEIQEKAFDLVGMVRTLVKSSQLRLDDKPVSISLSVDNAIDHLVLGDELLLHQILNNLVGNAEKFTEKGKIEVSVRLVGSSDQPKKIFEIRISDTGIGIPLEKQEMIFQSFRQVDGDIKRKFGGTGLGLAITKQIIESQGGTIQVDSTVGKGSTFTVNIPYRFSDIPIQDATYSELVLQELDAEGKHILVVEDNHMNRKYIGALLRKWQVQHTFAQNGKEGVQIARSQRFDLILMDIQMPEMDGYEASIAIRQSSNPNTHTPIVALTASALISQKNKAFAAGMNDYVSKPFKPAQLFEKIALYCGRAAAGATITGDTFQFHPRLDAEALQGLYDSDLEYARDMFEVFLQNTHPELAVLEAAFQAGDLNAFARQVHKIKPTFAMVGLSDLEELLQQLETAAKTQDPDITAIAARYDTLKAYLPNALAAVESDFEKLK